MATSADGITLTKLIKEASWLNPDTVLFKTKHGSHLYGLNHADSDEDFLIVRPTKRTLRKNNAKQTIIDNLDTTEMDFATFARLAAEGTPQSLEAMFAQNPEVSHIEFFRRSFHATGREVRERYGRTIKKFALSENFKQRRHALRLCLNLRQLLERDSFNPRLSPVQAKEISELAAADDSTYYAGVNRLSPIEIDFTSTI
jgi:hypothetical protein